MREAVEVLGVKADRPAAQKAMRAGAEALSEAAKLRAEPERK